MLTPSDMSALSTRPSRGSGCTCGGLHQHHVRVGAPWTRARGSAKHVTDECCAAAPICPKPYTLNPDPKPQTRISIITLTTRTHVTSVGKNILKMALQCGRGRPTSASNGRSRTARDRRAERSRDPAAPESCRGGCRRRWTMTTSASRSRRGCVSTSFSSHFVFQLNGTSTHRSNNGRPSHCGRQRRGTAPPPPTARLHPRAPAPRSKLTFLLSPLPRSSLRVRTGRRRDSVRRCRLGRGRVQRVLTGRRRLRVAGGAGGPVPGGRVLQGGAEGGGRRRRHAGLHASQVRKRLTHGRQCAAHGGAREPRGVQPDGPGARRGPYLLRLQRRRVGPRLSDEHRHVVCAEQRAHPHHPSRSNPGLLPLILNVFPGAQWLRP